MRDKDKTKDQLVSELVTLRQRVSELEASVIGSGPGGEVPGQDEGWYRRIIDAAYEGVWVIDTEGKTEYANQRMAEMLGCTTEEMLGRSAFEFVYTDCRAESERSLERRKRGIGELLEARLRRKDGSELWVLSSTSPIQDERGETIGVLGMITDITERKRAEEKIRFQAQLLDAVGQAVIAIDVESNIIYWNHFAKTLYGWSAEEVMGCHLGEILVSEDQRERAAEIVTDLRAGKSWSGEFVVQRRDGASFSVMITNTPVRDEQGDMMGIIGVSMDITERKRAEEELERRMQTLREQAQLLNLAHDAIMCRDMNDTITFWNHGAEEAYGWSREEALGESLHSLLKTRFPKPLEEIQAELLREGRWEGELVHTKRDGTQAVAASRWALKRDDHGQPLAILEINTDITEHEQLKLREHETRHQLQAALKALQESEARFKRLTEVNIIGVVAADFSGNIIEANEAFLQILGYTHEDLLWGDLHWDEITPPEYLHLDERAMEQLERSGVCTPYEKECVRKDGSRVPVLVGAVLLGESQSSAIGFVLDLTERRLDGEALPEVQRVERRQVGREEAREDLVAALRAMRDGHGGDLGPDEDLGKRLLSKELDDLRLADERLRDIVSNLHVKHLDRGRPFIRAAQSLAQDRTFLQEVEFLVELNRKIAPGREIQLTVDDGFPSELPALTRLELLSILKEALVNARRHSEARCVRVTLGGEEDSYRAEITDDGQGFKTEAHQEGMGIPGMREAARALGGELEVESEPDRGTRVRIRASV
jgi:PAS domain S-box-containing protein